MALQARVRDAAGVDAAAAARAPASAAALLAPAFAVMITLPPLLDHGGFFPVAWNRTCIVLAACAAAALLARAESALSRPALAACCLLAGYAAWTAASAAWAADVTRAVFAAERVGVYVLALPSLLLVTGRRAGGLAAGALVSAAAVCVTALMHHGEGGRLEQPVGYWNGLGGVAAIGLTLAAGLLLERPRAGVRAACVLAALISGAVLGLTLSRGAIAAAAVGIGVAAAAAAAGRGHAAGVKAAAGALAGAAALLAAAWIVNPAGVPHRIWSSQTGHPVASSAGPGRLEQLSLNGREAQWRVAWRTFASHPLAGVGAGGWKAQWLLRRPTSQDAASPHSLPLETMAELGLAGTALLGGFFAIAIAAGVRRCHRPAVPACLGALAVFLVQATVDWTWQLTGVGLLAMCCAAVLLSGEDAEKIRIGHWRLPLAAGMLAAVALSLIALRGNADIRAAAAALAAGNPPGAAADARAARAWMPWSYLPDRWVGASELAAGDRAGAAAAFRAAAARSPGTWSLWFDLARASRMRAHAVALRRALALDPRSAQIRVYCTARPFAEGCS